MGRRQTVDEAVDWVMQSRTREYRSKCLAFYRREYGDAFADAVKVKVERLFEKRKGGQP